MKQNGHRNGRKRHRGRTQRGSALLVSLMVMVGLSLLGLSFVAISETENAISVNERNKTQTAALAEAGAKAVVQWFQDPTAMETAGLLPANDAIAKDNFKQERTVNAYKGFYKPSGRLFDTPFGPKEPDMFFGDEERADVLIVAGRNEESDKFLEKFNNALFFYPDATDATKKREYEDGRIASIRIYAPPNVGGALIGGFWVAGQRYGVATIAVTAEKRNSLGAVISQSICRLVLAPFPLPGPSGAIQAIGGISPNGNYEVHWGAIESEQTTETYIKREATSLPWFDAYDRAHIERGYDSSMVWKKDTNYTPYKGTGFPRGMVIRPTDPAIAAKHEFQIIDVTGAGSSGGFEPTWDLTPGKQQKHFDVTYVERTPTAYPIKASDPTQYTNHNWLAEMLRRQVEDPWFQVRTRGWTDGMTYGEGPLNDPHPYDYATAPIANAGNFVTAGANKSHYFQYQTFDNRPLYKQVRVPRFDYDFWKAAALGGRGQKGVYYLKWVSGGIFTDGLTNATLETWIKKGPGFYFFDTKNAMNPQNGGPGQLVEYDADPCGAKGVVYMNVTAIKSTGNCGGVDALYNQPGEPYRDIGYRRVNEVGSGVQVKGNFTTDAAGNFVVEKAYNNEWSYQDLPFSNNGAAKNDFFDVCLAQRPLLRESTATAATPVTTEWVPLPYYPGCKVGNNISMPTCDCSEPHEPYLNIRYTGAKLNLQAYWDNPTTAGSVRAKVTVDEKPTGAAWNCQPGDVATKSGQERCATNAYDKIGGLALLNSVGNEAAVGAEGVIYNEGDYKSTGNAAYYGSVVVGGVVEPKGTQEIWYDACLASDCWPPKRIPFPRVMITSTQIQ